MNMESSFLYNALKNGTNKTVDQPENNTESEVKTAAPTSGFLVDRTLIQEIQHDEQDVELQDIGMSLSVYHQDELEQGILAQVDQALEQQEREQEKRRLDKQIKEVSETIRTTEQRLSQDDVMSRVKRGETISIAKALNSRQERERRQQELANLRCKQKELTGKRAALDGGAQNEAGGSGILEKKAAEESEQERMIRLGEMTPFGTTLSAQQGKPETSAALTDFEKYFQSQASLNKSKLKSTLKSKSSTEPVPSTSKSSPEKPKKKTALKPNVLIPKKRKHKDKLGSKIRKSNTSGLEAGPMLSETQTINLDSDPDFVPDDYEDNDDEDFVPRASTSKATPVRKVKRQRKVQTKTKDSESEWGTDDSDWESSGDEERVIKKRKKGQEMDDGEAETYSARVRIWEREEGQERESVHKLDGGLDVPNLIWQKLYKYQQVGVQWMWELYQNGTGGILGDEMGLGKTIQVIAFLASLKESRLRDKYTGFRGLGASIIVCPTTVMHQWVKELHTWWPPLRVAILHESGSFGGSRNQLIKEIAESRGVLITSYQGLVKHQEPLLRQKWHVLILDEGHKIRNPDAQATLAAKSVPTPHRIALTGSPMQNNLRELWSLFDFVYPSRLGTLPEFLASFAVPITQGGYANATEIQVATAYHCALSLKETIKPYLLRRMKNDVKNHIHLPNKNEQVLFCKLTQMQRDLYRHYVDSRLVSNILEGRTKIFVGLINLRKICNHPDLFSGCSKLTRNDESLPKDERYGYWEHSGKMQVVRSLLKIWHKQGHRVLLFTQGRQMMCILENFIQDEGYKYLKLDGTTSIAARQPLITEYNNNPEHFVFLLTTRVGGLGVNLTGADRVVIFDPDWNPATDTQARERAWRIGQERQVTIYRLVTAGTIEEKIYHRQIFKQFLTNKVLNDPRQRRFFKSNDLYELFTLKEGEERSTETSALFAGTGSEVKIKSRKARAPSPQPVIPKKIEFSQEKIDRMKELAQKLSQQFTKKLADKVQTKSDEKPSDALSDATAGCSSSSQPTANNVICKTDANIGSNLSGNDDSLKENVKLNFSSKKSKSSEDQNQAGSSKKTEKLEKPHKGKHKEKKKHKVGAKFEGERVSHLVKCREYSKLLKDGEEEEAQNDENQDDYVLRKLFKKSGLQTALKHDNIMAGGGADVALVEREARHVAQEAVARLKQSRRQCFNASTGVPTWTGNSGHVRAPSASASASTSTGNSGHIRTPSASASASTSTGNSGYIRTPSPSASASTSTGNSGHIRTPSASTSAPSWTGNSGQVAAPSASTSAPSWTGNSGQVAAPSASTSAPSWTGNSGYVGTSSASTSAPSWTGNSGYVGTSSASTSAPSWTGNSVHVGTARPLTELPKKKEKPAEALGKAPDSDSDSDSQSGLSAFMEPETLISGEDLLALWEKRNRLLRGPSPDGSSSSDDSSEPDNDNEGQVRQVLNQNRLRHEERIRSNITEDERDSTDSADEAAAPASPPRPQVPVPPTRSIPITEQESDLLDQIRVFLAFGGAVDGQASTEELLYRFPNSHLASDMAPLFKCMLQSLAEFHRNAAGRGIWTLKPEFR